MYSGTKLVDALAKQHEKRSNSELFKSGVFTLDWRSKVGSFPHPDNETLVSAGEPCGDWNKHNWNKPHALNQPRAEDKRTLTDNLSSFKELPLNGYVPAASIRGIVRAWVSQYPHLVDDMRKLLGWQNGSEITAGKIEFLDAFPIEATKLTLDITNHQQDFQVFHTGFASPLSLYTLGDGHKKLQIKVAIRGCRDADADDVETVWEWLQQALSTHGVGSRTASGYGALIAPKDYKPKPELTKLKEGYTSQKFDFILYSQGSAGINPQTLELRPTHWRGWLRSWCLRFFLGVMSEAHAKATVNELFGTLGGKGLVRLRATINRLEPPKEAPESSKNTPTFYKWTGNLEISAPADILNEIILPIIRIAVRVGGVGRGWRRPLHIVNGRARGCYVKLTPIDAVSNSTINKPVLVGKDISDIYNFWRASVKKTRDSFGKEWGSRYCENLQNIKAEVFSPSACAVYRVPGPDGNAIDESKLIWVQKIEETRGKGMKLIYDIENNSTKYKQPLVGGSLGSCSWVSIQRINPSASDPNCYENVCIFMGDRQSLRSQFLSDLAKITDAVHLFGKKPN